MMLTPDPKRPLVALADDDEIHSEVVSVWLDHHGFDVVRFGTGDELLAWAQAVADRLPDAVLLDVEMPGLDGFEVHAELRRLPTFSTTPTVFVSGMAPESLVTRAQAAGANAALNKDEHLLPRLSAWLATAILP
ncbi:MAG TPA: response regulator [Longimicrobium sp.]|jgi:two-component system sensor histidine kinase ChiS